MVQSNNDPTRFSSLKVTFIKNSLQHIHGKFVVAPINKVNGNVAFMYKNFHIQVQIKNL